MKKVSIIAASMLIIATSGGYVLYNHYHNQHLVITALPNSRQRTSSNKLSSADFAALDPNTRSEYQEVASDAKILKSLKFQSNQDYETLTEIVNKPFPSN